MAQKTRAQLQAENAALFVENTTGDITPTLEKTYNQDVNDSCMLLAEGTYTTISLVDWTALVAANGLVPGWQYLVTSAFVSTAFGQTWNILCVADSVSTVLNSGWVVIGEEYVPCSLASWLIAPPDDNVIFYNTSPTNMALTPDQALAWSGLVSEGTPYCPIYILTTAGDLLATRLTDDSTQIRFDNVQKIDSTAGEFGTYTPQTAPAAADDIFTPYANPWNPAFTVDGAVVTSVTAVVQASYSIVNNILNYSILFSEVVADFSAGTIGYIEIAADQFPIEPTGGHVISGGFDEYYPVGIKARDGAPELRINLQDKTGTVTTNNFLSITGQCQL